MRIFLGNFLTGVIMAACLLTAISDYRHRDDPDADVVSFIATPVPHRDVQK